MLKKMSELRKLSSLADALAMRSYSLGEPRGSPRLDEDVGEGGDSLLAAGESEMLGGGGLDGDGVDVGADNLGDALAHGVDVRHQLRCLGADCDIDVGGLPAGIGEQGDDAFQDAPGVDAFEFGVCIGEVVSYVAETGGAEQGVAEGMEGHVGVTVAEQADGRRYVNAAKPELAPRLETVYVDA